MRRRSKSVFVGAEVAHYLNSKNFHGENDEEQEVNITKNSAISSDDEDSEKFDNNNSDVDEEENENTDESVLHLIQQVHGQIPANDKLPFDKRLNLIDWSEVKCDFAKRKILEVIEQERKHRLLHEILDEAHKRSIKKLDIKKPTSTIGLYISENKDELKKTMAKIGSKNIITTANDEFKKLSEKERQSYMNRAHCAKDSYNDAMKKYTLTFKKGGNTREKKLTPFVLFQQHEHLKGVIVPRPELLRAYNDLPIEKKIIWILRYLGVNQGDKLTYDQYINAKETLNKDDFQLIDDYEGKPKRTVAYNIFVKEYFKNSNSKDLKTVMKECAAKWKIMPAEERFKYQHKNMKGDWEKRMFEYLNDLPEDRRNLEIDSNSKLSRKAFEKMLKTYSNTNSTFKSPTKKVNFSMSANHENNSKVVKTTQKKSKEKTVAVATSPKKTQKIKLFSKFEDEDEGEDSKDIDQSRKSSKNEVAVASSPKKTQKPKLFSKFEDDDDDDKREVQSPVFDQSISSPRKEHKKKKMFSKFNDDANDSIKINDSLDMPKPITVKKENEKKRKNADISFPKPIKQELETDSEESKTKKSKFSDDSFEEFQSYHNSTEIEPSPKKKKKKVRQDSSSENEAILKPPKTVQKYFAQQVHKGPASTAKAAFEELTPREKKKVNTAFKKVHANFLSEFEKRIQGMSSKELDQYARIHKSSMSQDDSD